MSTDLAYKKAAIDWLLAHGQCERIDMSTHTALFTLADRGVDYEGSDLPEFGVTALGAGDSFTEATTVNAFCATIKPLGCRGYDDQYTFMIPPDDMQALIVGAIIRGVISAAEHGDHEWKARFPEQRARYDQMRGRQAAREAAYAAARAAKDAAVDRGEDSTAQDSAARAAHEATYAAELAARGIVEG